MKKVEAIIRPEAFQELRQQLDALGVKGLTVSEVAGCGQQKGQEGIFRGSRFEIKLYPKVKVEMVIENHELGSVVDVILEACATNEVGDGKIFVSTIDEVFRIRTGETGKQALI
ncbi:P-II family nitrogen regulator [Halobacillus litoralis]|uniref:P-II family nitrogen regulator n=1 Tax=Halobacillus litoralis TaxID=45668 RepID=A0A845DW18_9BACI|nr:MULTISPECIES: P-II family nitrogen regulator [Halobacillus]MCA1023877.1 P-II family nitrogen regulator [Halobacillus litoralis]MYL21710.1 P-II family nitrogen regulator [Halobacillus litoralis]MYL31719.1 P-II family nitrogen regulator [Halobacillus halophilus]MYL39920.1 P-II family nitrogen regulator [Halobacillus litoralis]